MMSFVINRPMAANFCLTLHDAFLFCDPKHSVNLVMLF